MKYTRGAQQRRIRLKAVCDDVTIMEWNFWVDASGLGALLRSVDMATTEAKALRSIGLRRKRRKKRRTPGTSNIGK